MHQEGKGYSALRRGRTSVSHATYYVTLAAKGSRRGLTECVAAITAVLRAMEDDGSIAVRGVAVMPDHAHLLFRLGERISFSQVMGRLKAKTKSSLAMQGMVWQENGFERRLRPDDEIRPVLHYMFMNPYRAGLLDVAESWSGFLCGEDDWAWFKQHLRDELPYPEWLPCRKAACGRRGSRASALPTR